MLAKIAKKVGRSVRPVTAKIEWFGIVCNLLGYMLISQGLAGYGFILGIFGCLALIYTSYTAQATKFILLNGAFLVINFLGVYHV